MYDFLIGLDFDEVVEALESRGIDFDLGSCDSIDEAREDFEIYIGAYWLDHYYFDTVQVDGRWVVSSVIYFDGWD